MSSPLKTLIVGSAATVAAGMATGCTSPNAPPPSCGDTALEPPLGQPIQLPNGDVLKLDQLGGSNWGIAGTRQ